MSGQAKLTRWRAVLCGCGAFALFTYAIVATGFFGPGVTPDSVHYLGVADNLVAGRGLETFQGKPLVSWPPLYPMLLSVGPRIGVEGLSWARFVNAGLSSVTVLIASLWLAANLRSRLLFLLSIPIVAMAPPVVWPTLMVWSEPLFLLATLVCLSSAGTYLETGERSSLLISSTAAFLAALSRHAVLPLVLTGCAVLVLNKNTRWKRAIRDGVVFGIVASLPSLALALRNLDLTGHVTGRRPPAAASTLDNFRTSLEHVGKWFFPSGIDQPSGSLLSVLFLILALTASCRVVLGSSLESSGTLGRKLLPFLLFVPCYWLFLTAVAGTVAIDPLGDRLMSPIFLPLLFLVFSAADQVGSKVRERRSGRRAWVGLVALTFGWPAIFWSIHGLAALNSYRTDGIAGYGESAWRSSALVGVLSNLPPAGVYFSNAPDALYFLGGKIARQTPERTYYRSNVKVAESSREFVGSACGVEESTVVWFNGVERRHLWSKSEILNMVPGEVALVATTGMVDIYRLRCESAAWTTTGTVPVPS